jgi:hypothetical protein
MPRVLEAMTNTRSRIGAPEWFILIGAVVFVVILVISAVFEADIRWLHFFQAWMYIATIVLSLHGNRWGYFIGVSAAGLWDYANLVATTFFFNGLQELARWVHTGHLARPDLLIAVPAWLANLSVIIGCLWAYTRLPAKMTSDFLKAAIAFALTTGFFAADMALFQPRYLGIFSRMLHLHLR